MKALLESMSRLFLESDANVEYQSKKGESDSEAAKFTVRPKDNKSNESQIREPAPLNLSRFRNSRVRTEVLRDLSPSGSPRKSRNIQPMSRATDRSVPTVASSVAEIVHQPVSPSKAKNIGVHIGFQLNMIVVTLKRVVDEINADSQRIFLRKIRCRANRINCIEKLRFLLERKRTNIKFHAFVDLVQFSDDNGVREESISGDETCSPVARRFIPTVLPLGQTHPLTTREPYVHVTGYRLNRFAAVGRITGVLLSIIRIQKISFINELIRLQFDKLYFIRSLS